MPGEPLTSVEEWVRLAERGDPVKRLQQRAGSSEPLTATPTGERKCRCVMKHVPEPRELHRHHVWPTGEGGPDTKINLRWLCPTSHSSAHRLWREYAKRGGQPSWEIRKVYNPYVRRLVDEGWAQAHPVG